MTWREASGSHCGVSVQRFAVTVINIEKFPVEMNIISIGDYLTSEASHPAFGIKS